ncbi:hypothetical protein CDV31_011015 [Fusarium ambrosium]|uniref:Uncharacterized protein n=1 Tax=Fusarium ambrosium TaxID=131363 RepID=A0A428TJI7_9HYPO|nr:hypothetical protein CDV31_011015 [Fusarium ambrosium]
MTYTERGGSTVFVVGGDGLSLYNENEYLYAYSEGILVTSTARHKIMSVHVAQHGDDVAIWYQTRDNSVYYLKHQASSGRLVETMASCNPIRLLGSIDNLVKVLMTSDGNESQPLYASRGTINTELETMTIRLQLEGIELDNEGLGNNKSTYMRVILNGRFASLEKTGLWFEADSTGVVNIVVTTSDLSSHNIYVTRAREPGGREPSINEPIVRPIDKILDRLAKYKTGQQLKNAKTPDGKPIVASGQMTDKEADQAVRIFSELRRAHGENKKKELRLRGVSIATEDPGPSTGVEVFRLESCNDEEDDRSSPSHHIPMLTQWPFLSLSATCSPQESKTHRLPIYEEDDQLETLAAQSDILENDEDMALLLKYSRPEDFGNSSSSGQVTHGSQVRVQRHHRARRSIANWGFVKDWSNSIGAFVNAGLDVADDKMANTIGASFRIALKSHNGALDQFQHGGGLDSFKDRGSSQGLNTATSNLDGILPFLTEGIDEVKAVINALGELAKTLRNDIWDLIRGKCSFGTLMERVGKDIADFVLEARRKIATHASRSLKNLLNRNLHLPIFSYLWKKLTGKDLTPGLSTVDAALTVKPFFESLQLATSTLDAITSFWDYTFDGVGLGAYSTEISIINGAVAAINILVNLPLPSDRSGVPGIPHHITVDNQPEVARAAEVGKLGYTGICTALQTLLIAHRNDGVNLTAMNGSSGVVQVMIKGGGNMTQLMMIPDRQSVADISGPEFTDLVFGDGLSQEKQLEFPILRKELEFPILKQEVKVEVVEE